MFDKSKFAQVLKDINETYSSQRDFSKKSGINRTYLSQYMNMKLDEPPKPKTLKKLSDSSNGTISYENLMVICGYIDKNNSNGINDELIALYEKLNNIEKIYKDSGINLNFEERKISHDLFYEVLKSLNNYNQTPKTFNPTEIVKDIDYISNKSKNKIAKALQEDFEYFYYRKKIRSQILNLKLENGNNCNFDTVSSIAEENKGNALLKKIGAIPLSDIETTNIPILGTVKAGYDYLAQENIIDYIAFKVDGTDKENYYALNVVDDSMTPLFDDGDTVIIHKQEDFRNGENCVVLINGDEATIKKVYKGTTGLELKAVNPYYPPRIFTEEEIKKLPVKIIGVVEKSIRNFRKK